MLISAVSDDITDLTLYKINLSAAISAANAAPVPTGLAMMLATSAAERVLSGMFVGTTALFFTQ